MRFILRHWQGHLPLAISIGVVFVSLSLFLHLFVPAALLRFTSQPLLYIALTITYISVSSLVIFPWQFRGTLRALDNHYLKYENNMLLYAGQAILLAGLILAASVAISRAQSLVYYWEKVSFEQSRQQQYQLSLSSDQRVLHLSGLLDFGITADTRAFLTQHKGVIAVTLESNGGQIYEGRGLAQLFKDNRLHTYAFGECSSSCTTAFIGGEKRFLGNKAKLGFHQYAIDKERRRQDIGNYDLLGEQQKDIDFFQSRGIEASFLERVFESPEYSMWYPEIELLLSANVIDAVVDNILP